LNILNHGSGVARGQGVSRFDVSVLRSDVQAANLRGSGWNWCTVDGSFGLTSGLWNTHAEDAVGDVRSCVAACAFKMEIVSTGSFFRKETIILARNGGVYWAIFNTHC
jgi:hypothetical protein